MFSICAWCEEDLVDKINIELYKYINKQNINVKIKIDKEV